MVGQIGVAVGVGVGGIVLLDELEDIDLLELRLDELDIRYLAGADRPMVCSCL